MIRLYDPFKSGHHLIQALVPCFNIMTLTGCAVYSIRR
jgi:hypothetical protein